MTEPDLAIALRYEPEGDDAPRVDGQGTRRDRGADRGRGPRSRGRGAARSAALRQLLGSLEVDSPIPVAAFAAVAEILAHLYRVDQQLARRDGRAAQP